ncbi:similar to Saccharomyces cerevisiae YJL057C IKS1 Putative serine/threonine kinase [Maudiozyma saulgeensis]|uniref:Similar to Saccharomyces cerevisiae YJL057C IKS1 Putative serine/threonine kinase n=1 Tax=Maudiozyma saulgeensis TaxID=1789683 RepID=A0A1X7R824_9SACH|nr:similar to Saccharomyces cerevisiae YJL057C IKS1 Putative serine/threonine kinase [Kazachstania saulgeensis]
MSLVPYNNDSLILKDSSSKSLMIVNPSLGELSYFKKIITPRNNEPKFDQFLDEEESITEEKDIASYVCPQCGTEIDTSSQNRKLPKYSNNRRSSKQPSEFNLSRRYFRLLQDTFTQQALPTIAAESNKFPTFIPDDLFIPGYFRKFFTTLSLLGTGARGSVFKVVHKIGDTDLGIFALKKISIGNDMTWFNKCIREVKALSSLTHRSVNLITYNHVWLEMDASYGLTMQNEEREKIPCLFILQQYCEGGNLEDCILIDIFKKFPEKISSEERKKRFRQMRRDRHNGSIKLGLSTIQILSIIRDIARGLHELHDIGIIHRDLKPSNLLLLGRYKVPDSRLQNDNGEVNGNDSREQENDFPTVVIGDLGESQLAGESRVGTGCTGTLEFTAPEIIITNPSNNAKEMKYNEYTFASDMYSLGMICYFIVFGELPFDPMLDIPDMRRTVKKFQVHKEDMILLHQNKSLKPIDHRIFELIESLLSNDVKRRPHAKQVEEILNHILLEVDDDRTFSLGRRSSITPLDDCFDEFEDEHIQKTSFNEDQVEEDDDDEDKLALTTTRAKINMASEEEIEIYTKYENHNTKSLAENEKQSHFISQFPNLSAYSNVLLPLALLLLWLDPTEIIINYFIIFLLGISYGIRDTMAKYIKIIMLVLLIIRLSKKYIIMS